MAVTGENNRKYESRKMPREWFVQFCACFEEGARWNNFNNWMINDYYDLGLSPSDAASKFEEADL